MCIRYSILSHTFASVSAAPAVAMLPTRNHMKLTSPLFLTVHVSIVTVEMAAELKTIKDNIITYYFYYYYYY